MGVGAKDEAPEFQATEFTEGYLTAIDDVVTQLEQVTPTMFPGAMPDTARTEFTKDPEKAVRAVIALTVDNMMGRIAELLIKQLEQLQSRVVEGDNK